MGGPVTPDRTGTPDAAPQDQTGIPAMPVIPPSHALALALTYGLPRPRDRTLPCPGLSPEADSRRTM